MLIDLYKLSFQLMLKKIYITVGRGRHAARLRSLNSNLSKLEEAKVLLLAILIVSVCENPER